MNKISIQKNNRVMVSICCLAYNHVDYIENAIKGFLSQKTDFLCEIIIHDDASTDGTTNIIKKYKELYPELIHPIFQDVNQYSLHKSIFFSQVFPHIRGEFIALCEGDDYWIDPNKIQKQVEALSERTSCNLCFHPAYALRPNGKRFLLNHYSRCSKLFALEDVVRGGGGYMPTASLLLRKKVIGDLSNFYLKYGCFQVGDYIMQVIGSIEGGALYLPDIGSVYRENSDNSWSKRNQRDRNFQFQTMIDLVKLYISLNDYLAYRYDSIFEKKIRKLVLRLVTDPYIEYSYREEIINRYNKYLKFYPFYFQKIYHILRKIRKTTIGASCNLYNSHRNR